MPAAPPRLPDDPSPEPRGLERLVHGLYAVEKPALDHAAVVVGCTRGPVHSDLRVERGQIPLEDNRAVLQGMAYSQFHL